MVRGLPFNLIDEFRRNLGEPFGEPELFWWHKHGQLRVTEAEAETSLTDREMARAQIIQTDASATDGYLPLDSEPELYLEYSAIGNQSWQGRINRRAGLAEDEIRWALELTRRFGTLKNGPLRDQSFMNSLMLGTTEPSFPTVWDVVSEARSIALVLLGHQFSTQGATETGRKYSNRRAAGINLFADLNEAILSEISEDAAGSGDELRNIVDNFKWGERSVDEYRIYVAADISNIVTQVLSEEKVENLVTSSVNFGEFKAGSVQIEPSWHKKFRVSTLRGALWVQVANHIMNGSAWRDCNNSTCPRGIFRVERPKSKQRYCDQYCKDQQNNRDKYKKNPERYARKKS